MQKRQHAPSLHSKGKGREAPYDEGDGIRFYGCMGHVSEILQQQPAVQAGKRLDELNQHIENLEKEIDDSMKPQEHQAVEAIKEIPGIADASVLTL